MSRERGSKTGVNRAFRRLKRFGKDWSARRSHGKMVNTEEQLYDSQAPQDVMSVRAKNSGHGKKTADKWNQ